MRTWVADVVFVVGLLVFGTGVWHFSPAVALILGGMALMAVALLVPLRKKDDPDKEGEA